MKELDMNPDAVICGDELGLDCGGGGGGGSTCGETKKISDGVKFNHSDTIVVADKIENIGFVSGLVGVISGLGIAIVSIVWLAAAWLIHDLSTDLTNYDEGCGVTHIPHPLK